MDNQFSTIVDAYNLKLLTQNDAGVFSIVLENTDGRFELYGQTVSLAAAKLLMSQAKDEFPERAVCIFSRSRKQITKHDEIRFV